MRLRENLEQNGLAYDLNAVTGVSDGDTGVPEGDTLMAFADAAIGDDELELEAARQAVVERLGPAACADAAGIIATFNAMDRVADATGVPIEVWKLEGSDDYREEAGINKLRAAYDARSAT